MIRSWRDAETEDLFNRIRSRRFQAIEKSARVKLALLDSATALRDLALPGLRLERLTGDRGGQHSIRINDQYRICFEWNNGGAENVEIIDYQRDYH